MRIEQVQHTDDGTHRPADLSVLGARVLEMANLATAIHMRERVQQALRASKLDALALRHEARGLETV